MHFSLCCVLGAVLFVLAAGDQEAVSWEQVRAQIRKRGQGEKGRGSGLSTQASSLSSGRGPRPITASETASPRSSTARVREDRQALSAKLGSQWPLFGSSQMSGSMQRSAARSYLGLLDPMAATAGAFLPIQISPSPPSSQRSSRSSRSSGWTAHSGRRVHVGPAIDRSKCTKPNEQTAQVATVFASRRAQRWSDQLSASVAARLVCSLHASTSTSNSCTESQHSSSSDAA